MPLPIALRIALLGVAAMLMAACAQLIAGYSLQAYQNATSLKAETLELMSRAVEPFDQHEAEVRGLQTRLAAAREFVAGMPKNELSARQWQIMADPGRDLAGGFLAKWEADGKLRPAFIEEKKSQIGGAFDDIICLEANKEKDTQCVE